MRWGDCRLHDFRFSISNAERRKSSNRQSIIPLADPRLRGDDDILRFKGVDDKICLQILSPTRSLPATYVIPAQAGASSPRKRGPHPRASGGLIPAQAGTSSPRKRGPHPHASGDLIPAQAGTSSPRKRGSGSKLPNCQFSNIEHRSISNQQPYCIITFSLATIVFCFHTAMT